MKHLRPVESRDLVSLHVWRNNKFITNLTHGFRFPKSYEMEAKWFEDNIIKAAPAKAIFAIRSESSDDIVGLAQLVDISSIHRHAKLGIFIGDEKERGNGLGAKALKELIEFGFNDLNLIKIFLYVNATNKAAISLYKKHGFKTEGTLEKHYFLDGKWEDLHIMSLINE